MTFNWIKFFQKYGVEYYTEGPNLGSKDWVGLSCPLCRDDPSAHLGVNLIHGGFHCFRNHDHSGRRPHRLIQAILRCSYSDAQAIVGDETDPVPSDLTLFDQVSKMLAVPTRAINPEPISFPPEFRRLDVQIPLRTSGKSYFFYLNRRGFCGVEQNTLLERYPLYYTLRGSFAHRIIFPVYGVHGALETWTGRAIGRALVRYKTLSTNPDKAREEGVPVALAPISNLLFNYPTLLKTGGKRLFVVEGPFDSLKIDFYGQEYGTRATCLFGKNISDSQIELLGELAEKFDQLYLLLDPEVEMETVPILLRKLAHLGVRKATIPAGLDDPAELSPIQIKTLGD